MFTTVLEGYDVEANPESFRKTFVEFYNQEIADFDIGKIAESDVYIVWFCFILGNAKALISTTRPDGMYYELTYNINKKELYIDMYKKFKHCACKIK